MSNRERTALLPRAKIAASDPRFLRLLSMTLGRVPGGVPSIRTVSAVRLKPKARSRTLAGLTTYSNQWGSGAGWTDSSPPSGEQTITFYSDKLEQLSDDAATAIIVHELAHAWLNEYVHPEESKQRELEADRLAANWGFSRELEALDEEADSV